MINQFEDDLIGIRQLDERDVEPLYTAISVSAVELHPYIPWFYPEYAMDEHLEWIGSRFAAWERGEEFDFIVYDRATSECLGSVGLNMLDYHSKYANLGYWTKSNCKGRGIATRAARLAIQFAFEVLDFNRVEIAVVAENHASRCVAEKLGAHYEGLLRSRAILHHEVHDVAMYSILNHDI